MEPEPRHPDQTLDGATGLAADLFHALLRVRARTRLLGESERPLSWVMLDNLRIGATYAVVLEAFKLGT